MSRAARSLAILACVAALSLGARARAGEETPRLPWNPFATAHAGDWASGVATLTVEGGGETGEPARDVVTWRIATVTSDSVALERIDGPLVPDAPARVTTFSRTAAPLLDAFLDLREGETPGRVSVVEEAKRVGERAFEATRLAFGLGDRMGRSETVTLWLSRTVRGPGIVAMVWRRSPRTGVTETVSFELAGFGSAGGVDWGRAPASR